MNIAFVSSSVYPDLVKKLVDAEFDYINVTYLTYRDHSEIAGILEKRQKEFDAILFSGYLAYYDCRERCRQEVPWMLARPFSSHMTSTLLKAVQLGYDISSVSVDNMSLKEVQSAFRELGVAVEGVPIFCLNPTPDDFIAPGYIDSIIAFHRRSVENNHVTCCLSSTLRCYEKLKELDIPVVFIETSFDTFRRAFYQLYLQLTEGANRQSQIVVIAAEMEMPGENSIAARDELKFVRSRLKMTEKVYSFASRLQGIVSETAYNQYLIIATKADFSTATQGFNEFELFEEINSDILSNSHLGIGLGSSAADARQHAYSALERAKLQGSNTACLVASTGETVLFTSYLKSKDAKDFSVDEKIISLAQRSRISVKRMYQLYEALEKSKKTSFTSAELTDLLGISKRNMDRLIARLEAAGLARVVGLKSGDSLGRPRRLLQFSLTVRD